MFIDLNLCSTPIEPFNTLYFDTKEAQKEYFSGVTKKTIKDCSYNGSRAIRINMNYLQLTNLEYNYLYFEYDNRTYYCFIDDYSYINDNCSAVNVTIDYIQTYLFDVSFKKSLIKSKTFKRNRIKNIPYSQYSVSKDDYSLLTSVNNSCYINGVITYSKIVVLFAVTFVAGENDTNFKGISSTMNVGGKVYNMCTIFIPHVYDKETKRFTQINRGNSTDVLQALYKSDTLSSRIQDISILWCNPFDRLRTDIKGGSENYYINIVGNAFDEYFTNLGFKYYTGVGGEEIGNYIAPSGLIKTVTQDVVYNNSNTDISLFRQPYYKFVIGNQVSTIEVNPFDFKNTNNRGINIKVGYTFLYPFNIDLSITLGNTGELRDRTLQFTFNTTSPVPYSVSKWAEYYATHSSSVNDGLETQQKYNRQIAKRQRDMGIAFGVLNTAANIGSAFASFGTANYLANSQYLLGTASASPSMQYMGLVGMDKAQNQLNASANNSLLSGVQNIVGSVVAYENLLTEQSKQKALLDISWNDIKSSPDVLSSIDVSYLSKLYFDDLTIKIYLVSAINISEIQRYHKVYGYECNIFDNINIKEHKVFDYIAVNDLNIYSLLPTFITDKIVAIFESGIRFWYSEDTFLNYDVENAEV